MDNHLEDLFLKGKIGILNDGLFITMMMTHKQYKMLIKGFIVIV